MDQTVWIHLLSNKQEKYCDQWACIHKLVLHRHTSLSHVSLLQHRSNWSMNEPCKAPDVHTAWNFAYPLSRNMAHKVEGNLIPGALALFLQGTVL